MIEVPVRTLEGVTVRVGAVGDDGADDDADSRRPCPRHTREEGVDLASPIARQGGRPTYRVRRADAEATELASTCRSPRRAGELRGRTRQPQSVSGAWRKCSRARIVVQRSNASSTWGSASASLLKR